MLVLRRSGARGRKVNDYQGQEGGGWEGSTERERGKGGQQSQIVGGGLRMAADHPAGKQM